MELETGRRIGPYRLLFRLGKGGMGEVWAASKNSSELDFEKLIALKVLLDKERDSNAAVMFFDEAKAASSLDHAAIVQTTDLGQDGKIFYIAMDMVQGPSLTALLQRLVINKGAMPPEVVALLGTQIASALDYAHTRATHQGQQLKLIHRDISPHNVLLDLHGGVRLTDFGVARTAIQEHKSAVGTVRGKPSYMAPEQVVGGAIDARTDLFALGTVMYESSCLKRLFGRSNPVKSMDAVLKHKPKVLTELVPDFPVPLWNVIHKALQKDPENRFQSAAEMVEALNEASRELSGGASANRTLAELIGMHFEANAFDIEGRIDEAAEASGGATSLAPAPTPSSPSPAYQPMTMTGMSPQVLAWPTAHAPDPLAPEAIEEARTQFRAMTPSVSGPVMPMYTPSSVEGIPLTNTGRSFTGMLAPPPKKSQAPAIMLAFAAVLLTGTAALVVRGRASESATDTQAIIPPPKATIQAQVKPGVMIAPGVNPVTPKPKRVVTPPPKAPPTGKPKRRAPATRTPKPKPPKAPTTASFDEVRNLVKKLRGVDPAQGKKMFVTLLEVGRDNPKRLAELKAKVQAALKKAQP